MRSGALFGGFLEARNLACLYPQQFNGIHLSIHNLDLMLENVRLGKLLSKCRFIAPSKRDSTYFFNNMKYITIMLTFYYTYPELLDNTTGTIPRGAKTNDYLKAKNIKTHSIKLKLQDMLDSVSH